MAEGLLIFALVSAAAIAQPASELPPALRPDLGHSGLVLTQERALALSQAAIGRRVGDYTLTDTGGRTLHLASLRGKPLLVSFIYTGCFSVCPTATRTLKRAVESALGTLGPDSFNVVSVGFNLPFDTPDALRAFASQQGVYLPNWRFLSPDAQTLDALAKDLGFSYVGAAGGFDHITQVSILDGDGRVYRQVYGEAFPLPQLVGPLRELLTGTPQGAASMRGFIERVRLLCMAYDPTTGRYRYNYSIVLEIAGGLMSISAMAIFLLRELRKTRRTQSAR
jgi:protein SCO1/2